MRSIFNLIANINSFICLPVTLVDMVVSFIAAMIASLLITIFDRLGVFFASIVAMIGLALSLYIAVIMATYLSGLLALGAFGTTVLTLWFCTTVIIDFISGVIAFVINIMANNFRAV